VHNNIKNQKIILVGIMIIISLSILVNPFLNDVLSKNKKKTDSKISDDQSKSSNQKTDCKVGIQTSNSCNNTIIINLGNKDNPVYVPAQPTIGQNNTVQKINNVTNANTNKTIPMNLTEPTNHPPAINQLPSSSLSNHCELVPGPNMTFINPCSS
jgi:hypothetical protein